MNLTKERRESIAKSQNIVSSMNKIAKRLQENVKSASKVDLTSIAEKYGKEMVERKNALQKE